VLIWLPNRTLVVGLSAGVLALSLDERGDAAPR
jgi:hypothetical protein